ncbi:MAG: glycine zipper 2TM domain-containing protein [Burkholderiaceae bacterium]
MSPQESLPVTVSSKPRLHPLMALAAMCVIALSITGVAAMTGLLKPSTAQTEVTPLTSAVAPQTLGVTEPNAPPAAKPAPVAKAPAQQRPVSRPAAVAEAQPRQMPVVAQNVGVVESVREIKTPGQGTGLGAVAGGVLGGVLGNQVGGGSGKKAMTVIGAVGGGVLGNHVEKNARATTSYNVTVRMDNGERRTVSLASASAWRVGDRVKVENGQLIATQTLYAPAENRNTYVDYKG